MSVLQVINWNFTEILPITTILHVFFASIQLGGYCTSYPFIQVMIEVFHLSITLSKESKFHGPKLHNMIGDCDHDWKDHGHF